MKKILKWILIVFLVLLVGLFIATKVMSKSLPTGKTGPAADTLAAKILDRIDKQAWDSLPYISWTFFGGTNHYVWDKVNNKASVSWSGYDVILDLDDYYNNSIAKSEDGAILSGDARNAAIQTAWMLWCNDSFWLYAPYKLNDKGVTRSVITEDDKEGLLVTYESGGTTPGDSYLWWVDETGLPTSYDMWTSIIPIKGINATWTNWKELPGGAMIAQSHKLGPIEMSLTDVKAGSTLASVGAQNDIFR